MATNNDNEDRTTPDRQIVVDNDLDITNPDGTTILDIDDNPTTTNTDTPTAQKHVVFTQEGLNSPFFFPRSRFLPDY